MRSLVSAVDARTIRLVRIQRPPPNRWKHSPKLYIVGNTWLTVLARARRGEPVSETTASWETNLLVGAFRDAAHERGLDTVLGRTAALDYPVGPPSTFGAVIGDPFVHDVSRSSAKEIAERLRGQFQTIAAEAGIERVKVRFIKPTQLAVIVDVTARRPARVDSVVHRLRSLRLEGWLLAVYRPDGKVVWVAATAQRDRTSDSWGLSR